MPEMTPDMLAMLKQQQGQAQQPDQGGGDQAGPGPGMMGNPQVKQGERMHAGVWVKIAMKMLEKALPVLGSNSEEGKVVLESLSKLGKGFGKNEDKSLVPSEILEMQRAEPSLQGQQGGQQQSQPQQMQQPQG